MRNVSRPISWAVFVSLLTFIVYLPALQNGFVNWDDNIYIFENQNIRSMDLDFIRWSFSDVSVSGNWHPVTWISLALDYAIWGPDPKGFHLTNIILHSLNTLLVFILAMRLIVEGSRVQGVKFEPSTPVISAAIAALLFGIHPVHVESVAWATERKDVLSTFFFLVAILSYIRYNSAMGLKRRVCYSITLLFFVTALMTKPMVVTLPIVLLILDFYPFQRLEKDTKWVIIEKIPFFLLSLTSSVMTMWAAGSVDAIGTEFVILTRLFISTRGYIFYILKMIAPVNLAPLYPYPLKVNILAVQYLMSAALFLFITIYSLWSLRKGRLVLAVWIYFIVTLLPVIGIVHVGQQETADRYTYMPSIGPFLLAGLTTGYIIERNSKRLLLIASVLLILSGVLINKTVNQIRVWHDSITLWSHGIRLFPDASLAHGNLGEAYIVAGNYQLALRELNRAIELDLSYAEPYYNRGMLLYKSGNYQQAIKDFSITLEIKKRNEKALINRGMSYFAIGQYEKAVKDLNMAIDIDPMRPEAYYNLGLVYSRTGDSKQALIYYKKAAELGLKKAEEDISRLLQSKGP